MPKGEVMKDKSLLLFALALILCLISLGCSSSSTAPNPLAISISSLPAGTLGVTYSQSLTATGGVTPYSWGITSGALPAGLTLSSSGTISGTPTSAGSFSFTVRVSDSQAQPAAATAQLSITINAPPLAITTTSLPSGKVNEAYSATLAATGGIAPYTWTLTSGSLPAGLSLSSAGVIAGTPTASATSAFTVQAADSQTNPATATAQLSIAIASNSNAPLKGNYTFLVQGSGPSGQVAYIGEFIADGDGHLTSGEIFQNSVNGQPSSTTYTGTYSIDANGLGTATFNGSGYTSTWSFSLSSDGNGRIIRFDDTNGQGSRGSATLRKQDTSAFSLANIKGYFVYGYSGADLIGNRLVEVGEFSLDGAGNVANGIGDSNDAGSLSSIILTGTYAPVDFVTGRATAKVDNGGGPVNYVVYVVNSTELLIMSDDPVSTSQFLLSGSIYQQVGNGSFTTSSLSGNGVLYGTALGQYQGNFFAVGVAGLTTADAAGNLTLDAWENDGGTFHHYQGSGTYTVASNGRVMFTGSTFPPILYLIGANSGIGIGIDQAAAIGYVEPQASAQYSNSSVAGTYAFGNLPPVNPKVSNSVATASADGAGTMLAVANSSNSSGLSADQQVTITYSMSAQGIATVNFGTSFVGYFYAVSPTRLVAVTSEDSPRVFIMQH